MAGSTIHGGVFDRRGRGRMRALPAVLILLAATEFSLFAEAPKDFRSFLEKDRQAFEQFRRGGKSDKQPVAASSRARPVVQRTADGSIAVVLESDNLPARIEGPGGSLLTVPVGAPYGRTTLTVTLPDASGPVSLDDHSGRALAGLQIELAPDFPLAHPLTVSLPLRDGVAIDPEDAPERLQVQAWSAEKSRWEYVDFTPASDGTAVVFDFDRSALLRCIDADSEIRPVAARAGVREVRPYAAWFLGSVLIGNVSVALTPYEWFMLDRVRYLNVRVLCDSDAI